MGVLSDGFGAFVCRYLKVLRAYAARQSSIFREPEMATSKIVRVLPSEGVQLLGDREAVLM